MFLVSYRYGSFGPGGKVSFTEAEYREARRLEIPCFVYMPDESRPVLPRHLEHDPAKLGALHQFKDELLKRHTVLRFQDTADLASAVTRDIADFVRSREQ